MLRQASANIENCIDGFFYIFWLPISIILIISFPPHYIYLCKHIVWSLQVRNTGRHQIGNGKGGIQKLTKTIVQCLQILNKPQKGLEVAQGW